MGRENPIAIVLRWFPEEGVPLEDREIQVRIERRTVTKTLVFILGAILVMHVFVRLTDSLDLVGETLWRRLSNVDTENTFPTWLSAVALLVPAVLFWLVARHEARERGRHVRHWMGLAVIFLVLSVDEVASFHEAFASPVRGALDLDGVFFYGWVVPALALVVVIAVVYLRMVIDLAPTIRWRVVAAAVMFVGGAVGLEMVSGLFGGETSRTGYFIAATIEETLEIGSIILLIDTLLLHLGLKTGAIVFTLQSAD
ncbi:hypothetical protein BH23ACT5_BH23ACT5_12250 [soil metagenome]